MFRRRKSPGAGYHLRNFFWPNIGWRRSFTYFGHRVGRLKGSRYAIAAGFAFGAAISFTPLVGLHIVTAALFAWIARANVIASAIGTLVGNPWTFPIIWVWIYQLGRWMGVGEHAGERIEFATLFGNIVRATLRFDLAYLQESAWPIFGPMLAGSIPTAIVAWLISYYVARSLLRAYQAARLARLHRRRQAREDREAKAAGAKNGAGSDLGPQSGAGEPAQ